MLALASVVASLVVTAPFHAGGTIPKRYTCDGADVRPALGVREGYSPRRRVPPGRLLAFEVVDVDAPGGAFVHWLQAGRVEGRNDFGRLGWGGPCPPPGDPPHRYVFRVYLLARRPALRQGFTDAQLRRAIRGHVVAKGVIVGRYRR